MLYPKSTVCVIALIVLGAARVFAQEYFPIFNGENLEGWHPSGTTHHGVAGDFSVADGVLSLKQSPYGQGGVLLSDSSYKDFDLVFEYMGDPGTNGGLLFHSSESGRAYQLEIVGDGERGTGALFGEMFQPLKTQPAPDLSQVWNKGDWNHIRLRVTGLRPKVTLWINGIRLYDFQIEGDIHPQFDQRNGKIGLQLHWSSLTRQPPGGSCCEYSWKPGAAHRYKNIAIRRLSYELTVEDLGLSFVPLPAGSIKLGVLELYCPPRPQNSEEANKSAWEEKDYEACEKMVKEQNRLGFTVNIDSGIELGKYEITQHQFEWIMGFNPSKFKFGGNFPVTNVTWEMANEYVQRLSELDAEANYRLPTEFEWEYAASAGTGKMLSWKEIREQAWIQATRNEGPKEVGQMQPNDLGLYDMLGNVWEWVSDFHNGDILPSAQPPENGDVRVLKGGGFTSDVVSASPFFHGAGPGNQYDVGFRVVRIVDEK